jgi:hypothetical protein
LIIPGQALIGDDLQFVKNIFSIRSETVGKPNFNFQKRQKELAKKKKNEEKRQRKLEKNITPPAEDPAQSPAEGETK